MQAWLLQKYGSIEHFKLEEVRQPVPGKNEVLVKVHACSVNSWDADLVKGRPYIVRLIPPGGIKRPKKIMGCDIAGVVEKTGSNVTRFKPGDKVFGDLSNHSWGGFAEYANAPEKELALIPENLSFEDAAALPQAGVLALIGMRNVRENEKVLLVGAGGGTGSIAIQLGKMRGAEITGVDRGEKLEFMRSMGADHVIDYTAEDVTQKSKLYDLIIVITGSSSMWNYKKILEPRGTYRMMGGSASLMLQSIFLGPLSSLVSSKKLGILPHKTSVKDLTYLSGLVLEGRLKIVIDRIYPFEEVPQAIQKLKEGKVMGKVVVRIASENNNLTK